MKREERDVVTQTWMALFSSPMWPVLRRDIQRRMNVIAKNMILFENVSEKKRDMLVGQCQFAAHLLRLEEEMEDKQEQIMKKAAKVPKQVAVEWLDDEENAPV